MTQPEPAAELEMRLAAPEHAEAIVAMLRQIHPEVTPLMAYGCRGAVEFTRRQLAVPAALSDTVHLIARLGADVAGCAEIRRAPGLLLLNQIAVLPQFRSHGLGGKLLAFGIRETAWRRPKYIELDVFEYNARALAWYERLGFERTSASRFSEILPQVPATAPLGLVRGLPAADAVHAQFGFSQFSVVAPAGAFTVGRVGDDWFRLTEPAAVCEPSVFATLARLDPARRYLAILREQGPGCDAPWPIKDLFRRFRMRAEIEPLLEKLG